VTRQTVEPVPTLNETELPEALDEIERPPKVGHPKENRPHEQKVKNTTGLKPA